jgi:outer membrane lipopolysaccharide assembly protein LptE/RlpB
MALAAFCLLNGCGYHLAGGTHDSSLIAGKSIAIPMCRNKTYRPNLETVLTGSLVNEFAFRSSGKLVAEDAAELVLTATIVSYTTVPVSYTAADKVREYRKTMKVEANLTEKRSEKVLWKGTLAASQDYPAYLDPEDPNSTAKQQNSDDAALREISRKIAEQLFQKMSENF